MIAKNHVLLNTAAFFLCVLINQDYKVINIETNESIMIFASSIFGSLLPDIDEPRSYIGRRFYLFSCIVGSVVKHRTFTHYLILPITIVISARYLIEAESLAQLMLYGLGFGVFFHSLGDLITNTGIRGYLFPFFMNRKIVLLPKYLRFDTDSAIEYTLMYSVMIPINFYLMFLIASGL